MTCLLLDDLCWGWVERALHCFLFFSPPTSVATTAQMSTEFIIQKWAPRHRAVAFSFCQGFLLQCRFYAYVQMSLILKPQEKKFNLVFIKVQPLPCQSNPFISLGMDCSCQPMITLRYLDNSLLIIPTSERLPCVNYIATNEAQMHSLQGPLFLPLALYHTWEPTHKANTGT